MTEGIPKFDQINRG